MRDGEIERIVRLNTLSPLVLTKYVVRAMMAAEGGRIVNNRLGRRVHRL